MSLTPPAGGADRTAVEGNTHSFIVKIWLEEAVARDACAIWRGHITHVPSGERRYVKSLEEITAFIKPFLASMGVTFVNETPPAEGRPAASQP